VNKLFKKIVDYTKDVFLLAGHDKKRLILFVFSMMVLAALAEAFSIALLFPLLSMAASDNYLNNSFFRYFSNDKKSFLIIIIFSFYFLNTLKYFILGYYYWVQSKFIAKVQVSLGGQLFQKYMYSPYKFHINRGSAELIRNINTEVDQFVSGSLIPGMILTTELCVLTAVLVVLVSIKPFYTILAFGILGSTAFLLLRLTKEKSKIWGGKRQKYEAERVAWLQQGLAGIKDIRVFGAEDLFIGNFLKSFRNVAQMGQYQNFIQNLPRLAVEFSILTALVLLLVLMPNNSDSVTTFMPTLGLFLAAAFRLIPSTNRILSSMQSIQYTGPVIALLKKELLIKGVGEVKATVGKFNPENPVLEIKKLFYRHDNDQDFILKNINFKINQSEIVGVMGESGSGKSTLANIVLGLLEQTSGEILIHGVAIEENIKAWQSSIGYVSQNTYLINGTIKNNIEFNTSNVVDSDARIYRVLEISQLLQFVEGLPLGINSELGDCGNLVSGGQRQRISIARALYKMPEVLILDEATSSLDPSTEMNFMRSLLAMSNRPTIILISHNPSVISMCDRVYELNFNKLISLK
jgi:ABC-type multidrug transport system fused ATPase/permease subunit